MFQQVGPFFTTLLSQPWSVIVMGLAVTGLCFLLGRSFLRPRTAVGRRPIAEVVIAPAVSNRRAANRRAGNVVAVVIQNPEGTPVEQSGWVLDRSSGGLRLEVDYEIEVGKVLRVRPSNASEMIPWTAVIVRSCRPDSGCYQLGVQFVKPPSYGVLMLFG